MAGESNKQFRLTCGPLSAHGAQEDVLVSISPGRRHWANPVGKRGSAAAVIGVWIAAHILATAQVAETHNARVTSSPATNQSAGFNVRRYEIVGNTLLPAAAIDRLLAKRTGPDVTLETIRHAVGDLQRAYQDRGYTTVTVALPPQQLTNGIVRVKVTETRLSQITVEGTRSFSSNDVLRALPSLHTNMVLNSLVLQKELDRANRNPDRQIVPKILHGATPGACTLVLTVNEGPPSPARR